MPELPEVETVRQTLETLVVGRTIESVDVRCARIIQRPTEPQTFAALLSGQTFKAISRRGKFLLLQFEHLVLVSHLRMEGRYALEEDSVPADKHTHVIFHLTDGMSLRYSDVRKFGTMHLFVKGEEYEQAPLNRLGPEPLSSAFTVCLLSACCAKTARAIKNVLLDQHCVAGLGNIYVDETLYRAGIHPLSPAEGLSTEQLAALHRAIRATLSEAVAMGGSTVRTFVNSQGHIGAFQTRLRVYGRKGAPCARCGRPIKKIKVGGRGTHYCPNCQKEAKHLCLKSG
ncbi:MAG: DNA-formamidopyrimidine glycosylase [Sporolactobacillus sp.]